MYEDVTLAVWNLPDDPDVLIENAETVGAKTVDIKVHDGGSEWSSLRHVTPEYVERLKRAGLTVSGWGYCYLDYLTEVEERGNGIPELEVTAAINRIADLGLHAYTMDAEAEMDHADPAVVAQFFDNLNAGITATVSGIPTRPGWQPVPLGAYVWVSPQWHGGYPVRTIASRVSVLRPMCYPENNAGNSVEEFYDAYHDYLIANSGRLQVAPVFSITRGETTPEYLAAQVRYAKAAGAIGYGIWERSAVSSRPDLTAAMLRAWHGTDIPMTPTPGIVISRPPLPMDDDVSAVDTARDEIFERAGDLYNLGHRVEGTAIQEIIKLAKGELN